MFVEEFPGLVSPELCAEIIARFESDPRRAPSVASAAGKPSVVAARSGTALACDTSEVWQPLVAKIVPALHESLGRYAAKYPALRMLLDTEGLDCTGPVIERVDPGQGFTWHFDQTSHSRERVIAGLLYLRDVADGGATEFKEQGCSVQPEAGKIVLFPPYWTHLHRGVSPSRESKYVMSFFWIYRRTAAPV